MLGVILCGGKSSRMGDDKGLLLFRNQTWAQTALQKISALHVKTVLSIDAGQFQDYRSTFSKEQLIPDHPHLTLAGPLLGILSVHSHFPGEDLLVLACDLPNMRSLVLEELLNEHKKNEGYEAIVYRFEEQIEPLCSVYTAKGLGKILASHNMKSLIKQSMMHVLETLQTKYIVPPVSWKPYFNNMNSPTDLIGFID